MFYEISKELEIGVCAAAEKIVRDGTRSKRDLSCNVSLVKSANALLTGAMIYVLECRGSRFDDFFGEVLFILSMKPESMKETLNVSLPSRAKCRRYFERYFLEGEEGKEKIRTALYSDITALQERL